MENNEQKTLKKKKTKQSLQRMSNKLKVLLADMQEGITLLVLQRGAVEF